jgi:hypothetical protein
MGSEVYLLANKVVMEFLGGKGTKIAGREYEG